MAPSSDVVLAFDLYGTLLSTESIAKELASHFGDEKAQSIAALWRRFQLEYTWRMNSMGLYKSFSEITHASLKHALAESSVTLSEKSIASLMTAYDSLGTFPDVPPGLKNVSSSPNITAYVFSNGTDAMVSSSVKKSAAISAYAWVFKDLVTVEEVHAYKPDPKAYEHLLRKVGKENDAGSVWLVSGNPFDVVGARAVGMQAAWVDRKGGHHGAGGWTDQLGTLASGGPTIVVDGVEGAVESIKKWVVDNGGSKWALV
ncbi:hypothetical protein ONS95_013972 [Cadophora gregata]|uniref:uncharacterized protein n=1 Tax=Cadophora gregata TaxID=51156 RepID=UPI0026DD8585|nr:uncharacterized protein ONS95_013972 [Cadophora gregata]KAK0113724.1 hypothetical protein ONS96_014579 [Cadophora gregata f. sp. sojae]KAK0114481.1 hypothetical protein ONS95_013972 [Cadophora gregata]